MGALFFEGMNYDVHSTCRLRPKSLNHDVGGTFFNFDRSRVSPLIEGFCNAIPSRYSSTNINDLSEQQIITQTAGSVIRIRSTYMQRVLARK